MFYRLENEIQGAPATIRPLPVSRALVVPRHSLCIFDGKRETTNESMHAAPGNGVIGRSTIRLRPERDRERRLWADRAVQGAPARSSTRKMVDRRCSASASAMPRTNCRWMEAIAPRPMDSMILTGPGAREASDDHRIASLNGRLEDLVLLFAFAALQMFRKKLTGSQINDPSNATSACARRRIGDRLQTRRACSTG